MKEVPEMPTEGQFVVMWIYKGNIWSDTYRWIGDNVFQYVDENDDFTYPIGIGGASWDDLELERRFFIA